MHGISKEVHPGINIQYGKYQQYFFPSSRMKQNCIVQSAIVGRCAPIEVAKYSSHAILVS